MISGKKSPKWWTVCIRTYTETMWYATVKRQQSTKRLHDIWGWGISYKEVVLRAEDFAFLDRNIQNEVLTLEAIQIQLKEMITGITHLKIRTPMEENCSIGL